MTYNYSKDPEEQLPDWLKALRNQQGEESEANEPAAEELAEDAEDTEEEATPPEIDAEIPQEAALSSEVEEESDPEWLAEIRQRHQEESSAEESETHDDLEDTKPQLVSAPTEENEEHVELIEEQDSLDEQVSDVFEDVQRPESAEAEAAEDELAPGEIPSWLEALRPAGVDAAPSGRATATQPSPSKDSKEEEGPLAGLSGILPVEPEITQIGRGKSHTGKLEISRSQRQHRVTLEEMIAGQSATSETLSQQEAGPMPWLRWLIAGALLLASLVPLLGAAGNAPLPPVNAVPEVSAAYGLIEELPPSATVLVAFEVQSSLYGEIEIVASSVVGHLLEKDARLNFISTLPTGPALADRLMREQFGVEDGYLNLGYLSGGMAALRHFASHPRETNLLPSLWTAPALQDVDVLSDFDLILIFSSDAEDARAWIEQVGAETSNDMIAATSAQASPLLYAYLQSEPSTLKGLVGGIQGAASYENLRNQDGAARNYWDSYSYVLGAAILLILSIGLYGRILPTNPPRISQDEGEGQ